MAPAPTTAAAAVAGVTAAAAYLDAKFHITKDLGAIRTTKAAQKDYQSADRADRNSLYYRFEASVKRLPTTQQCIWSRDGSYTWRETYAQAHRYAQYFLSLGLEPGKLIGFYMQNHPEFMFSTIGSWSVGSAPALINYNLAGDALVQCLQISGAKLLIVDSEEGCRSRIEDVRERLEVELGMTVMILDQPTKDRISALEPTRPDRKYRKGVKANFPMCLMYTSGSTGFPKACPFRIANAWALAEPRINAIGLKTGVDGDRWYVAMPLYHGTGFTVSVSCMMHGITLCIGRKFSVSRFWDEVRASDSTIFVYVGETARYLLAQPPSERDKDHRARAMFGNGMRPDVWKRFGKRFGIQNVSEFFNSTEGVFGLMNVSHGDYLASAVGHHGLIQRALLHGTFVPVKVDHDTQGIWRAPITGFAQRTPYDEGGEIIVKVPNEDAFVGYWNNPEATAKKFERDVFKKGDIYYRTGDALRRTTDGRWYFMDRLGDTFRWKSENVSTAEVAEAFGGFPDVVEAIVYGVEVPGHDGRAGCAAIYIPPAQRKKFPYNRLLAHLRQKLPKYAVPIFLRITSEQQPMHNNKQNKTPLRKEGIDLQKIAESDLSKDRMLWCPYMLGYPKVAGMEKEEGYVPFEESDLEGLKREGQRLAKL